MTASLLVALVLVGQRNEYSISSGMPHGSALVATILSNQSPAADLSVGFRRNHNQLASFAWTNGSRANTGNGDQLPRKLVD